MNKYVNVICILLLSLTIGKGQSFQYQAKLPAIPADGFYKIVLTPQIATYASANFSDIRLFDSTHTEVPYLLQREEPVQYKQLFKEYELISKHYKPGAATTLILRNAAGNKINNMALLIKNSNVRKKARLSGSSDSKEWYSIEDDFTIQPVNNQSATAEVKLLDFPLSDYEYYKLEINDSLSTPINIVKAGYYDTYAENGKYTLIPGFTFTQQDSANVKQSFIRIKSKHPAHIDKLTIKVTSPQYFHRQAEIQVADTITGRRKKKRTIYITVAHTELKSFENNNINVNNFLSEDFLLVIHNKDNPPLQIQEINVFQLNTYVVAPLKKSNNYSLKLGNTQLNMPSYDLAYFKNQLPGQIPLIEAGPATAISANLVINDAKPSFFTNKLLIWMALAVAIALLGYLSYKMVKDMKSSG